MAPPHSSNEHKGAQFDLQRKDQPDLGREKPPQVSRSRLVDSGVK